MAQSKKATNPSRIIGLQFSILSPDEIRKASVANIVTRDTYVNNKPVIGGLFDPRMGVLDPGLICPTDGLNYMQTPGYFGHIELARPIFYIQYLNTILKILRCICVKCSKLLIDKNKYDYLLKLNSQKRWLKVFKLASKVSRCGDETCGGCGCKQPRKIMKEGLATLIAEWDNMETPGAEETKNKERLTMKMTPEAVLKIFRRISDEDVTFMGFSAVWSRPDWMICQVLAVPPPAVRPSVKHDAQQRSEDDISHIIVNIIKANRTLQEKLQQNASPKVIDDWTMVLQYYCATMVDNKIPGVASVAQRSGRPLKSIKERLVGKPGRVRGNLMGKRVDFSARSVITPDANIGISQLGVPLKIAKNITFPEVVNKRNKKFLTKLVLNGPDVYPGAKILEKKEGDSISLRYVDRESIELNNGDIVHRHLINGDPVLFNRQPTLHRMSMMCHFVKVLKKGDTFRLNVADTKPYNADFDGDEMNMHGPQDYESAAELTNLAAVARQIISPANNKPIIGIFQDSLLGAYRFTRPNINFDTRTAMNLIMAIDKVNPVIFKDIDKRVSGFELLTQILPPMSAHFSNGAFDSTEEDSKTSNNIIEIVNGNYLRGQLNKAALGKGSKGLLHSIFNDFNYQDAADFIDNLQSIVTEYMKLSSYSVGISDLLANNETNNKISDAIVKKKIEVKNLIDQTHLGTFENTTGKSNEEEFESKVNSILQKAAEQAGKIGKQSLAADNRFVIMVNAGSKGSGLNIAQMISCLGQQNVDGKRIPYGFEDRTLPHYTKYNDSPEARGFVESSFIQGLTPTELFFHAMGGRTGLIDTAVKTSTTGYIQRRLIKGLEDLRVHYDMTVRNNKNKIIQFAYGDDNIDAMKVEAQQLDLVSMTREEVYAHFQMPNDESKDGLLTTNYTKPAIKRMKKQKELLVEKTTEMVNYMMDSRNLIVEHVFKYSDGNTINIPVHFMRIINNIHNQLSIQSNSMVNITPIEFYELVDKSFANLMKNIYAPPTALFKIAYYYYLSPKNILTIKRFNKKALVLLLQTLTTNYNKAVVHPGEMVGMIAAQSIGEPTTQMTLNTFHFAGVASKSNATRGVPRVEEILSLSENPKKPSVTIHLKQNERDNIEKAQELKYSLEYTSLRDVVQSVSICFDPDNLSTLIEEDQPLIAEYNTFQNMIEECQGDDFEDSNDVEMSKWIVRLELDKESMLDKHISTDDIHFALSNSYGDDIHCVYADMNADKLVFRVRLSQSNTSSKTKSLDQSDEIYKLKNFQNNLLDNIILRGVKKIPKVLLRKMVNEVIEEDGNFKQKDGWVLDTVGTNLKDILTLSNINSNKTTSNDIQEVYRTLGIEAARQSIFNELSEAMDHAGVYINYHHISMLCDRMTATQKMVSIFRHGINNDDIGPIAKASFEETPEMFLRAARHAELDVMTGVSSNIMCGQEGYFGTGSFQVMLDVNKMRKLGEKQLNKETDISMLMTAENPDDKCSDQNIQISSTTEFVNNIDTGDVNDDYDIGF
jgi:DNA-directed RNA polymerase II subunit RPB1